MHIWTDAPLAEIWHQLRYFRNSSNVYGLLTGFIKSNRTSPWAQSESVKQQAYEIASCIQQAEEYFEASERVGLATKPLLQFYEAQALSKALILANDSSIDLSKLRYHGLSTRPSTVSEPRRTELQAYSDDPSKWEVEQEFAVTNDGVLPNLARIVGDSAPRFGIVLRFKELIRIIPDLSKTYHRHYGEPSNCFYLYGEPKLNDQGIFEISFSRHEDIYEVLKVFPEFASGFQKEELPECLRFRSTNALTSAPCFGVVQKGTIAGRYYVRPHESGIHKSSTILYSTLFILGNVVRYKPAFWMKVIEGKETGSVSIVEALCNLVKRRLPNDVLEGIWHEQFTYGSPAYLS
jgi:hypothetical protein